MRVAKAESISFLAGILIIMFGSTAVFGQKTDLSQDFEKCKIIANDQARLNCLKNLLTKPFEAERAVPNLWPLVKTPNPSGGREAVSIMRTADTTQSDPDLAGLMIRCHENGLEVVLALVRPLPPRAKRNVVVSVGSTQSILRAETSSTGSALVLPIEPTLFTTGSWQGLNAFVVTIQDPEAEIRGTIPLDGLAPALAKLSASCPSG